MQQEYKRKPDVWVVYRGPRKNSKIRVECFKNVLVDDILDPKKRRPLIDNSYEILDVGVGESFEQIYKTKYKV